MKTLNKAVVSVFVRENESIEEIKKALLSLAQIDEEKENVFLQRQTARSFEDKKIVILKIVLEKTKQTNIFLKNLLNKLSQEQKELLSYQSVSRLDSHMHFFIRLDKQKLLKDQYEITDSGDCFHIKLHIAAFPSKRENALETIEKLLKQ